MDRYAFHRLPNGMTEVFDRATLMASLVNRSTGRQFSGPRLPRAVVRAAARA